MTKKGPSQKKHKRVPPLSLEKLQTVPEMAAAGTASRVSKENRHRKAAPLKRLAGVGAFLVTPHSHQKNLLIR